MLYIKQGLKVHQRAFSPINIIEDQYLQTFVHTLGKPIKVSVITTTKTQNSIRSIPMNETARYVINELKSRQKNFIITSNFVVASLDGNFMATRCITQTFQRICEENNIECRGVHALRHTFGSLLLLKGVDIKVVSKLLGHSTVKFIYDRYIHLLNNIEAQSINLLSVTDITKYKGKTRAENFSV